MSDTSSGGGKGARAGKQKGEGKGGGARRSGGAASETGATRTYAYASADKAQKVLRRAVGAFVKAGTPLDVRLEGASITLRLPPKEQQTEEFRKLARRLRPKTGGGGKKGGAEDAPETGGADDAPEAGGEGGA
ncbi:MAG TPA: hypothetical protein VF559_03190 [Caulobacteraceae bacterium]|jgi:hypothetical protein